MLFTSRRFFHLYSSFYKTYLPQILFPKSLSYCLTSTYLLAARPLLELKVVLVRHFVSHPKVLICVLTLKVTSQITRSLPLLSNFSTEKCNSLQYFCITKMKTPFLPVADMLLLILSRDCMSSFRCNDLPEFEYHIL